MDGKDDQSGEHPGEGWNDGLPDNWGQLRMFVAGGLFALGLFTLVFAALDMMRVGGERYRELAPTKLEAVEVTALSSDGDEDLARIEAIRAGLLTLDWKDAAIFGLIFGPMAAARRARFSVRILGAVLACAFSVEAFRLLRGVVELHSLAGEPAQVGKAILSGLLALFTVAAFVLSCCPAFWRKPEPRQQTKA